MHWFRSCVKGKCPLTRQALRRTTKSHPSVGNHSRMSNLWSWPVVYRFQWWRTSLLTAPLQNVLPHGKARWRSTTPEYHSPIAFLPWLKGHTRPSLLPWRSGLLLYTQRLSRSMYKASFRAWYLRQRPQQEETSSFLFERWDVVEITSQRYLCWFQTYKILRQFLSPYVGNQLLQCEWFLHSCPVSELCHQSPAASYWCLHLTLGSREKWRENTGVAAVYKKDMAALKKKYSLAVWYRNLLSTVWKLEPNTLLLLFWTALKYLI